MPRLPDRTQLGSIQPQGEQAIIRGVQPLAEQASAQLGQSLANVGFQGMAYAKEAKERKALTEAADAESKAVVESIRVASEFENDQDYETMETRYREKVSKAHGDLLTTVSDPLRRQQLQNKFMVDMERGAAGIRNVARSREVDTAKASLSNLIAENRELALTAKDESTRASLIESTLGAIEARRASGLIGDAEAESIRQKSTQDYALGAAEMLSPQETISKLSGETKGTIFDFIPSDTKHRLVDQAKTRIKQESAILRTGLSEKVTDASAAYLQGLSYDNPPTRNEFIAAYPDDGDKRYAQFVKTQQLGVTLSTLATASPEDRRAILERENPVQETVGAGFAADSQRFGMLVKSVQSMESKLTNDPAMYAIQYSDPVRKAYDAMQQNPALAGEYATVVTAEQQRMGSPEVKLLPEQQAKSIVAQFNQSDGEDAAALIEGLSKDWGNHWPTVYKQLSKDLPPAALVIASGVDPATSELLARNSNIKTDELRKGLEKSSATDADKAVDEALSGFQQTLASQGGTATYAKINEQAKRLAYTYMAQGTSPAEAADKVYRDLVDNKYVIVDSYRVPRTYDADSVQAGASAALENIDASKFGALAPKGVLPEFISERIGSALKRDGQWVTNEDESGLVLMLNGSIVKDAEGNRIERTFDELVSDGTVKAATDRERMQREIQERR